MKTLRCQMLMLTVMLLLGQTLAAQRDTLIQVFFDPGSFHPLDENNLPLAAWLNPRDQEKLIAVEIKGFCDDVGATAFNDSLSYWRARYVRKLIRNHQEIANVSIRGMGEIALQGKKTVSEQRSYNRRVEIRIRFEIAVPEPRKAQNLEEFFSSESPLGESYILENLQFPAGSHVLLPESYKTLNKLVLILQNNPGFHILITGHVCCESNGQDSFDFGTHTGNLSHNRAKIVYDYLIFKGIDPGRLSYLGMKSRKKLGRGDDADMRVEIQIMQITR